MLVEILANSADALVVIDDEQRVVLCSPGAERIFRCRADEVIGHSIDLLLPESVQRAHRDSLRDFEDSSIPSRLMGDRGRIVGRRMDGSEFPADASITRIEVEGQRYYAAVIRDMTDRERAEHESRRSRAELAEAQSLAQVGSWEWEIDSEIVRWTDDLRRIVGLDSSGDTLRYSDFLALVHPEDREQADSAVQQAMRRGTSYDDEFRIVRGDGGVRVIHARGRLLHNADGKPLRMLGTAQDITERREADDRASELIRQQTAGDASQAAALRFRFLAEASQMLGSSLAIEETLRSVTRLTIPGIADWCSLDLVGTKGELRRVEVAHSNPEKVRIAEQIHERFPPDASANTPAAITLQRGESVLIEDFSEAVIRLAAQDEEHRALLRSLGFRSAMCVPLVARDRLVGLITLATAESERRFGPDDLALVKSLADRAALAIDNARLFEQAKAAAHAREDAVATVSHDLRSPLGVMSVNLTLLEEPDLSAADRERALGRMKRAVAGMQRLISDLLDVTRLEAGAVVLRRARCDAEALCSDACDLEQRAATARSIRFTMQVEPGLRVVADADRIVQVIANLLNNAVRHSPEGGRILVSARAAESTVIISIADEGPGVPPELRDRIFERFWQNESRQRGAAGLGLSIARALVELHGGRIWAEDAPHGGARFCFTLLRNTPTD